MITIDANSDSKIILFLSPEMENPFFLFVFKPLGSCGDDFIEVYAADESCGDFLQFTINVDFPFGIYEVDVYEQADYANLDPLLATFLGTVSIKVQNPENYCWPLNVLLDENIYPILDENENFITT